MIHLSLVLGLYCMSLLAGSWLWLSLVAPRQRTNAASFLALSPLLGIAWIGLFHANAFSLKIPFGRAHLCLILVTAVLSGWTYFRCRNDLAKMFRVRHLHGETIVAFTSVALVFCALLLFPVLKLTFLTTPWRTGADAAGYAGATQFILDGHGFDNVSSDLRVPVSTIGKEFLITALRRGIPLTLATYARVFRLHPGQLVFYFAVHLQLLLFLCAMRAFWEAFGWLRRPWSVTVTVLAGVSLGLNCNIVYILLEGGHAQIAAMALCTAMLLSIYSFARSGAVSLKDDLRLLLLLGVLTSAAATFYTESIFLLIGVTVGYVLLSAFRSRIRVRWIFLLTPCVAFLLSIDIVGSWVSFQVRNVDNLARGGIGWPQPQWAYIVELLGLRNLYQPFDYGWGTIPSQEPVGRFLTISIALSVLALCLSAGYFFAKKTRASQWILLALGLIFVAHLFFRFDLGVHSYAYAKIAAFLLPLLVLGILGALCSTRISPLICLLAAAVLAIGSSYNGYRELQAYREKAHHYTKGDIALAKIPPLQGSGVVLLRDRSRGRFLEMWFMLPLLSGKFASRDMSSFQQSLAWNESVPLLLLEHKTESYLKGRPTWETSKRNILWQAHEYQLVDPGVLVTDTFMHFAGARDSEDYLRNHGEPELVAFRSTAGWSRGPSEPHLVMVAPLADAAFEVARTPTQLYLHCELRSLSPSATISFTLNGISAHSMNVESSHSSVVHLDITRYIRPGLNSIQVQSSSFAIPNDVLKNGDLRQAHAIFSALGVNQRAEDDASSRFIPGDS